jgi:hypothetical protein
MKKTQNACKVIGTETQKKMNRSVFNWYKENFPNDYEFFGKGLNKELTFADVLAEPWNYSIPPSPRYGNGCSRK